MAIDWDELERDIDGIVKDADERTDARLASRISPVTRLTDQEIEELFPDPADVQRLTRLMKIVKSADDRNTKINNIVASAEELSGIVLTLLGKLA